MEILRDIQGQEHAIRAAKKKKRKEEEEGERGMTTGGAERGQGEEEVGIQEERQEIDTH